MLTYVLLSIISFLLIILYRYVPKKNYFVIICLILVTIGILSYVNHIQMVKYNQENIASNVNKEREQELFSNWWSTYQKNITELDRNWQWYNDIINDFNQGSISLDITYARLKDLEQESNRLRISINDNIPPSELSDYMYNLLASISKKTNEYANKQHMTIILTRNVANPETINSSDRDEQRRLLQLVMLREAPVMLFTAEEVSSIRYYLAP